MVEKPSAEEVVLDASSKDDAEVTGTSLDDSAAGEEIAGLLEATLLVVISLLVSAAEEEAEEEDSTAELDGVVDADDDEGAAGEVEELEEEVATGELELLEMAAEDEDVTPAEVEDEAAGEVVLATPAPLKRS